MRTCLLLAGLLLAGLVACSDHSPSSPLCEGAGPLAPDFATDKPWPEAVQAWAQRHPRDSLVYPSLRYRSPSTAEDQALVTASGGHVLQAFLESTVLFAEFRVASLASFASGDSEALQARIIAVEFGESVCPT